MKILVIDNYDSFTYNLVHLIECVEGTQVTVIRNDQIRLDSLNEFDKVVLSPGPGLPHDSGQLMQVIGILQGRKSILGICLGMQAIALHFGGTLKNLDAVLHGVSMENSVTDSHEILYRNIPHNFMAGRYHSWVVNEATLPDSIVVTARDATNQVMSLRHRHFDICGVQFHPESILSEFGFELMLNWIRLPHSVTAV